MTDELIERLLSTIELGDYAGELRNPDGPEAADRLQSQSERIAVQTEALRQIVACANRGMDTFKERQGSRRSPIWLSVNVLQDNLASCYGTALAALIEVDGSPSLIKEGRDHG